MMTAFAMMSAKLGSSVDCRNLAADTDIDGSVTVDEIVTAIGNALQQCAGAA